MPTPLVMLGSGDYATRLNVKGTRLSLQRGPAQSTSTNPDADARGHHGYHRPRPRNHATEANQATRPADRSVRGKDTLEITAPLHAAAAWLELQTLTLSDLADQTHALAASLIPYKAADVIGGHTSERVATPSAEPLPPFIRALRAAKARLRAAALGSQATTANAPRPTIIPVAAPFTDAPAPGITPGPGTIPQPQSPIRREPDEPHPQTAGHPQPHPRNPLDPRLFADDAGARRRTGRLQSHRLRARRSTDQKGRPQTASQQSALFGSLA